jgi:hypothetical protein
MAQARRVLLGAAALLVVAAAALAGALPVSAYTCATVPLGQAPPPAGQAPPAPGTEPQQPAWCLGTLASAPATRQLDQWGGWQDEFATTGPPAHLNNGDMGYRVFDGLSNGRDVRSRHFVSGGHWMVDMSRDTGGAALSPKQAFRFENGRLVIEADVAAGEPGFYSPQGDVVWPEVVWSTSPTPTAHAPEGLYLYGHFGGQWTGGCRMHGSRNVVCALEADRAIPTNDNRAPCYSLAESRVFQLSAFQACGSAHTGFAADFGAPRAAWRQCQPGQPDTACRDRFRLEWTQNGFVAYVNGVEYARDTGWPGYAQVPAAIASGQRPVYVFFGEWGDFSDANVYRFHWGRIAVNPHDVAGRPLAPSAAPTYCPARPQATCPAGTRAPAPAGMAAAPAPVVADSREAPPGSSLPALGVQLGSPTVRAYVAALLGGGQQPAFWVLLAALLGAAGCSRLVALLWRRRSGGQ